MLYDTIAESAKIEEALGFPRGRMTQKLTRVLQGTPKYVLSDTVARMVNTLAEKRPASLISGLPIAVMPFKRIWVEMPYSSVIETLREMKIPLHELENAENPVNLGYLLEDVGENLIEVTVVWDHRFVGSKRPGWWKENVDQQLLDFDRHVSVALLTSYFDVTPGLPIDEADVERELELQRQGAYENAGWLRKKHRTLEDTHAVADFSNRLKTTLSHYCVDYFRLIETGQLPYPGGLQKLAEDASHDIGGEWRRALGILMILNSKNSIEYVEQDRSKLSKARVKRGRLPTDNYRLVNMYLSKVQRNRLLGSGVKMADLARHLVSAHLKVRRTGVFLWSAHVRGYVGDVKVPEKYVTTGERQ